MMKRAELILSVFWSAVIVYNITAAPAGNSTVPKTNSSSGIDDIKRTSKIQQYIPVDVQKGCSLSPDNKTLTSIIKRYLKNGATMVEFSLKFRGQDFLPANISGRVRSKMFKPFFWVRTTGRFGTRLLLLKPNYDIMSFKSLEIKVKKVKNITLKENPRNCMDHLTYDDIEQILRELVMNEFRSKQADAIDDETTDSVCNLHILDNGGAEFTYYCCKRDKDMQMKCEYLQSDTWLYIMRYVIRLLKLIFILNCPLLLPLNMVQTMDDKTSFIYKLPNPYNFTLTLLQGGSGRAKIRSADQQQQSENTLQVPISSIKHMKTFKDVLQGLPIGQNKEFVVKQAEIQTEQTRLVSPGEAPSRIFETLYEFLVNCRVREMKSVEECCDANICCCYKVQLPIEYTWYQFSRASMKCITSIALIAPWIIRIVVYYRYEHEEMVLRKEAAYEKGYSFPFQGNFSLYRTPLHALFIFVYIFLLIESFIYGYLDGRTKEKFRMIFSKCYNDMSNDSRTKAFGGFVQLLLIPFTSLGCWVIFGGVFMWIILIPIALLFFTFYMFPTVNLTVRLLAHLVYYSIKTICPNQRILSRRTNINNNFPGQTNGAGTGSSKLLQRVRKSVRPHKFELRQMVTEMDFLKNERELSTVHGRLFQLVAILFCLITLYSGIFLLFEMVTFFLDVFIYTLIGFILYADFTMTYISLAVLLIVYGKDCFGSVSRRYREYSATINKYVMGLCEKQAMPEFFKAENRQVNRAFAVKPCEAKGDPCVTENIHWPEHTDVRMFAESSKLFWKVRKVAFFFTNTDVPKIPTKLLFDASHMHYGNKPGRLLHQYLVAFFHFSWIVAFLLFVLLVVMTFGETGKISASNQLLATIAGGILPFLLRNFIFRSYESQAIDPDKDINFRVAIHDLINNFRQDWLIQDINAEPTGNVSSQNNRVTNGIKQNENTNNCITNSNMNNTDDSIPATSNSTNSVSNEYPITNESAVANSTDEPVTNIVIYFDDTDINKFDFPILYRKINSQNEGMEPSMIPLADTSVPLQNNAEETV